MEEDFFTFSDDGGDEVPDDFFYSDEVEQTLSNAFEEGTEDYYSDEAEDPSPQPAFDSGAYEEDSFAAEPVEENMYGDFGGPGDLFGEEPEDDEPMPKSSKSNARTSADAPEGLSIGGFQVNRRMMLLGGGGLLLMCCCSSVFLWAAWVYGDSVVQALGF